MNMIPLLTTLLLGLPPANSGTSRPSHTPVAPRVTNAPAPSTSSGAIARTTVTLLFFADLYGRFTGTPCKGKRFSRRSLLHLKQAIRRTRVLAREHGHNPPLVVGGGSIIGPSAFAQYIFRDPARARWGVKFMEGMQMDLLALGPADLAAPERNLQNYLNMGAERRFPFVASNIVCAKKDDERCTRLIKPWRIVEKNGVRIGFMVLFPQKQRGLLMRRAGKWLSFEDPHKAWARHYEILKKRVHGVVLISHLDRPLTYPAANLEFLRKTPDMQPLLVLATGSSDPDYRHTGNIPLLRRSEGAPIVGSRRFAEALTHVTLRFHKVGSRWVLEQDRVSVRQRVPRLGGLDMGEMRRLTGMMGSWCTLVDRPLGGATLRKPMEKDAFMIYVLRAARVYARAEVAALNRSLLHGYAFPVEKMITEEKIARAVRTNSTLVTISMKGAVLISSLGKHATSTTSALAIEGLRKRGKIWYVNSRPIDPDQHYRVVTTKYVATGGGGLLKGITSYSEQDLGVRSMLIRWFEKGGASKFDKDPTLDVDKDFPDLWKTFVITGGTNLGLTMGNTSVSNPGIYEGRSQLDKEALRQINMDLTFTGAVLNRSHAISLRTRLLYGKTWSFVTDESGVRSPVDLESADEVQANLMYQWRSIRNVWSDRSWWAPVPFLDAGVKSEFTPGLKDETARYKLFTGIGGIGWELWENRLFVKVGGGARREYGEEGTALQQTLYGGWQLTNGELFKVGRVSIKGESRFDAYYIKNVNGATSYEAELTSKIYFAMSDRLFFNVTHSAYAYRERGASWSWAMDLLLGVNLLFDVRFPFIY